MTDHGTTSDAPAATGGRARPAAAEADGIDAVAGATAELRAGAPARQPGALPERLARRLADRIEQRLLAPGSRLPSVRQCAREHGVSVATAVAAYDRLLAHGLVDARPRSGYFVRGSVPMPPAGAAAAAPARRIAPADATALIRGMFQAPHGRPAPGAGTLPESWLDAELLRRALRRVLRPDAAAGWLRYGDPAGDPGLRAALSHRLGDLGIAAAPGAIVTTTGATHALDLVARTLLQPGDAVLVDDPGWAVEFARLSRLGMRLLAVPRGANGPDLAIFERALEIHRPRLYVTVPVLHNPTGASLAPAVAHRLLGLAEKHALTIVEDDTYAFLAPPHQMRLAQLDGLQRTVYVSGFSKILTPQWRIGYAAAAPALVERLVDAKLLSTLTTAAPLEQALAWCLEQGLLRRHAERVTARLDAARSRTVRLVHDSGFAFAATPRGLFGWVDVGVDTDRLSQPLLDAGWLIAPGSLFHADRRPTTLMRINFATAQDAAFWRAVQDRVRESR
jgi:DNA-binding transcriptional MocR family regulator